MFIHFVTFPCKIMTNDIQGQIMTETDYLIL